LCGRFIGRGVLDVWGVTSEYAHNAARRRRVRFGFFYYVVLPKVVDKRADLQGTLTFYCLMTVGERH
jgi:hypothetical protein